MTAAPDRLHKVLRFGMIAAYTAAVELIAIRAGDPADPWWWAVSIPFILWIVAPIAVPLLLRTRHWLLTAGVAAMAAYGAYIYAVSMLGAGVRSTSGLIFVFMPIYQWIGTAILIVIAAVMSRRTSP